MRHILIFEISLEGHHSVYLNKIASAYIDAGYFVSVTILEECCNHPVVSSLSAKYFDKIQFKLISPRKFDYYIRFWGGNLGGEIANWFMLRNKFNEINCTRPVDYIFFPYADYFLYIIGLIGLPCNTIPWSGICMQSTIHHSNYDFLAPIRRNQAFKKSLFHRVLKHPSLKKIFTIDELFFKFICDEFPKINSSIEYLADPADVIGSHTRSSARDVMAIPQNAFVVLVYGSISLRKGLHTLISALHKSKSSVDSHLLIVGKHQDTINSLFLSDEMLALKNAGQLHVLNRFVDDETEQMVFAASDVVWLGYKGHFAMSGVLVLAAKARRVIIATQDGLIGWHTRVKRLGIAVDIDDLLSVKDALEQLSNPEILNFYQSNISSEFVGNTWDKAVKSIMKATLVG